jgi:hypothetical protein
MSVGSFLAKTTGASLIALASFTAAGQSAAQSGQDGPPPGQYAPPPPPDPAGGPPQAYQDPGQGQYANPGQYPPQGQDQNAPPYPPQGGYRQGQGYVYGNGARQVDQDYAARYSAWAAQYCVDQRNNNTAAGAVIGGILGAAIGAGVGSASGNAGAGALVGGGLGAVGGAAAGASSNPGGCPPGYVIRSGAPTFVYSSPYYGPGAVYAVPAWYQPWVWYGGRWVYRPYRSWYYAHPNYWRPGWRPGPYGYRY